MKRFIRCEKGRFLTGAALIAMAIALSLLVRSFVWRVDLTAERVMTPTVEALELVRAIDEPVTITFVIDDESEDIWVAELTRRYAAANEALAYRTLASTSAALNNLMAQQGAAIQSGSVIVESDERTAILTPEDLYSYEYDQLSYYTTGSLRYTKADFVAQDALANALLYVTREDMPIVYVLTGHGEAQAGELLTALCRESFIDLRSLNLAEADSVPSDAAAVMILGAATGYDQVDAALIEAYLEQGGRVLLMSDYSSELGALEEVAKNYGMALRGGLVLDGDDAHVYSADYRYYLLPDVADTAYTQAGTMVLMPIATALEDVSGDEAALEVQTILSTSDMAYRKENTAQVATLDQEDADEVDCFALGLAASRGESLFVWLGSTSMLTSDADTVTSGGNSAFVLGLLDGMMTRPEGVALEPDSMLTTPVSAPTILALGLVLILPVALLIVGVIVTRKLRRA